MGIGSPFRGNKACWDVKLATQLLSKAEVKNELDVPPRPVRLYGLQKDNLTCFMSISFASDNITSAVK